MTPAGCFTASTNRSRAASVSGISDVAVNAILAFIESAKPQDEVESALVMQMACTHAAAMAVLATLSGAHGGARNMVAKASAAARLLRAYAAQVEVLRRLRSGGSQLVRVEHVHVNEGGRAVIGNVKTTPTSSADDPIRARGREWFLRGGMSNELLVQIPERQSAAALGFETARATPRRKARLSRAPVASPQRS